MQVVSFSAAFLNSQAIFKVEQGKIFSPFYFTRKALQVKERKLTHLFA